MKQTIVLCVAMASVIVPGLCQAQMSPGISDNKKLIKVGQDSPDTFYLKKNIREMEKLAVDGVVIIPKIKSDHGFASAMWLWFSKVPLENSHVQHMIDNLKATAFQRFTENFLWVGTHAGPIKWDDGTTLKVPVAGWFDDDFDIAVNNLALAARVAKEGGLKGIFLDMENYGGGTSGQSHLNNNDRRVGGESSDDR